MIKHALVALFAILSLNVFAQGGPGQNPGQNPGQAPGQQPGCHQFCPDWSKSDKVIGGAVQKPSCCCGEVPKKWPRLERFQGDVHAAQGGHNKFGYCGITVEKGKGKKVEIILSTDNQVTDTFNDKATKAGFDLDQAILAASIGHWTSLAGTGDSTQMFSYVARFEDDFWLSIDLGRSGRSQVTYNDAPEVELLRKYLDENCGRFQWQQY